MSKKTKILIIRFSSIGDIVLTSPVVRCLKQQLQGQVEIHYITKKSYTNLLEHNPHIDKVYGIEKKVSEVSSHLRKEKYTHVIDLHKNLRSARVKSVVSGKKYAFDKLNIEKWMAVNLKSSSLPDIHIVDRYMATVESLGVKNDHKGLDFFIDPSDFIPKSTLPASFQNGFVAFAIGGQHATKCLPVDKMIDICKKVEIPIVLLGGKEDMRVAKFIEDKLDQKIINGCGSYSIHQSASIASQAEVVITHDTGMMHIAAAFNRKIVSIWGNTIPEFGMYPYLPKDLKHYSEIIEVKELACRPCSKIGFDKCPKGHFKCMKQISEDRIVEKVYDLLKLPV
jgi:heptosyltransferase-2